MYVCVCMYTRVRVFCLMSVVGATVAREAHQDAKPPFYKETEATSLQLLYPNVDNVNWG